MRIYKDSQPSCAKVLNFISIITVQEKTDLSNQVKAEQSHKLTVVSVCTHTLVSCVHSLNTQHAAHLDQRASGTQWVGQLSAWSSAAICTHRGLQRELKHGFNGKQPSSQAPQLHFITVKAQICGWLLTEWLDSESIVLTLSPKQLWPVGQLWRDIACVPIPYVVHWSKVAHYN